ncbi:MAG: PAS domain S-box protein [Alphaproteobacteria bacterium]|nr:PAS domain S-box protein [Alphaproteobacteria bacterium]
MNTPFILSIKFKLIFFVTLCVTASLVVSGAYFFNKISDALFRIQVDRLESETLIISPLFASAFNEMKSDLSVISKTPPIQGIVRSTRNDDVDPLDESTTELWRTRLASIFSGVIENKPGYVQLRYIGLADGGREIVRVNNVDGSPVIVAQEDLQKKKTEPYFRNALSLKPGEIYFSAVSLNREHGKVQEPYLPVIRGIIPVHDPEGEMFGMIVINAEYEVILRSVLDDIQIEKDLYVINEVGDYIRLQKDSGNNAQFVFHSLNDGEDESSADVVEQVLSASEDTGTLFERVNSKDVVIQYYKDTDIFEDDSRYLAFALISPQTSFIAPVSEAQREAVLIIILSILATVTLALVFAMLLINPLMKMNQKIRAHEGNDEPLTGLPIHLRDEIGSLARSFSELYEKISLALKDEHAALERLAESEEQFRSAMKYSPVGKALVGLDGEWLMVNDALCKMLGYSEDELRQTDFQTLTYEDDLSEDLKKVQELLDGKISTYKMEKRYIRKDGGTIWGLLSVSLLRDVDGNPKHFISQIQDISDIKKAQQTLEELNTELEEFSYRTSHDLRSPLTSSIGLLKYADESLEKGEQEKARTSLSLAQDSLKKLEELLKDILDLARLKNMEEEEQPVSIKTLVDDALDKFTHMNNYDRLEFKLDLQYDEDVHTKKTRLLMIVENLISNAIKYQDTSKKKSFVKVETYEDGENVVFAVDDNGLGIPDDQQENMFVMFKRFHPRVSFGSGLGMYMMKKSADVIGGDIRFVNKKDGSRFVLILPKHNIREKRDV